MTYRTQVHAPAPAPSDIPELLRIDTALGHKIIAQYSIYNDESSATCSKYKV
jgi:hypothetical protein